MAAVAMLEPEIAAKIVQALMVATPSELGTRPNQAFVAANRSAPASERCMIVPVRMNSGSATNSKIDEPCQVICAKLRSTCAGASVISDDSSTAAAIDTNTGTPSTMKPNSRPMAMKPA